jgi:SAM-dependent methyltransferase
VTSADHLATTRDAYDRLAADYGEVVGTTVSPRFEAPLDLALLAVFAAEVAAASPGAVIDAGCGVGRVTRFLADAGLDVSGTDLSPGMIDAARAAHPDLTFDVGALTDLGHHDGSFIAAVAWYSIIATPPAELDAVWRELARVLGPSGRVLVAFQAGDDEIVERPNGDGSSAAFRLYRHSADAVARSLERCGFEIGVDVRRRAVFDHETTPQAFLVAQRVGPTASIRPIRR